MSEAALEAPRGSHSVDEVEFTSRDFEPESHAIIGAAVETHRRLGAGFLEAVYHEALEVEFQHAGIPFVHEVPMPIACRGRVLKTAYRADFLCFDRFIVELKAQTSVGRAEEAQVVNYLRASGLRIGLLLNFAGPSLQIRRLTNSLAVDFPGFPSFPEPSPPQSSSNPATLAGP